MNNAIIQTRNQIDHLISLISTTLINIQENIISFFILWLIFLSHLFKNKSLFLNWRINFTRKFNFLSSIQMLRKFF